MNATTNAAFSAPQETVPLPADPNAAARTVLERIHALEAIYEQETGALEAAQVEIFMAMQEEKLAATAAYQEAMTALLAQRDALAGALDPALRAALAEAQASFGLLAQRNRGALARMQRCVDRLANKICALAKADVLSGVPVGYGQNGGAGPLHTVSTSSGEVV